jgi:hypothetical protein
VLLANSRMVTDSQAKRGGDLWRREIEKRAIQTRMGNFFVLNCQELPPHLAIYRTVMDSQDNTGT